MRSELTASRLRELLDYHPETGIFRWNMTRGRNRRGSVAGCSNPPLFHVRITVDYVPYYAHQLAWLYVHGEWAPGCLDHRDGNPSNNAISNLRPATNQQNQGNSKRSSRNTTGFKGVGRCKKTGSYIARINVNGKIKYLGSHATAEVAHAAYMAAAAMHFGTEFARAS